MSSKILLVEDEALIAMPEAKMLEKHGYEVVTAYKGEKAVEAVDNDPEISLILMDIDLGKGIDGTEAAEKILERHDIPIVFLTSHSEKEYVERVRKITNYGYVLKNSGEFVLIESIYMAFNLFRANKTIVQSEERYRTLFETMTPGVIYQNADGMITSANPAAEKILGLSFDQMKGKTSMNARWKMITEDGKEMPGSEHPAMIALRTGQKVGSVTIGVFVPEREEYVWLLISAIPLFNLGEDKPYEVYTTFDDITERKRAEDALRESEKFIKTVMDHLPIGIAVNSVEPAVEFSYMNDNFPKIYRTTREALANPDVFWDVVYEDPEFRQKLKKRVENDCASGNPEQMQWQDIPFARNGKGPFYISARNIPIHGTKMMISTVWDGTERKLAEDRLKAGEQRLSMTLNSIGDAVISTDIDGKIIRMNPVAEKLTGWPFDSAEGRKLNEIFYIINAHTRQPVDNPVEKVLQTGKIVGLANHTVIISKDGNECQIADSASPIKDEKGNINGVVLVFRDVTEKYEKDRQLKESEEKYKTLFNNSPVNITIHEKDTGEVIDANEVAYTSYGYTSLSELKENGFCMEPPYSFNKAFERIRKAYKEGFQQFEWKNRKVTGEIFWEFVTLRPIRFNGVERVLATAIDITERKEAEKELQYEKTFLNTVLDNIKEAIIICNEKGEIIRFNESARRLHGLPEKLIPPGQWAEYYNLYYPDGRTPLATEDIPLFRALHGEEVFNIEIMVVPKDGKPHILSCNGHQLIDNDNKKAGAVIAMHDITDYKEAEKTLQYAVKEKNTLMQELNHRVKNNLNMVSALINLKDSALGNAVDLSDIKYQIDAIQTVHEKLSQTEDFTHIELGDYIQAILESLFTNYSFSKVEIDNNIEAKELSTKKATLLALITNEIATNAVKYGFVEGKNAIFTVSFYKDTSENNYLYVLSNTGNPFPEEVDFRNSKTLGMRLVNGLVTQLNGTIELRKKPNPVFTIRIPIEE